MTDPLPLARKRIIIARSEEQSEFMSSGLAALGAEVILVPVIKIVAAELSADEERKVSSFFAYDVVVFSSPNAVRQCLAHLAVRERTGRRPYIIAIGIKTAGALKEFGLRADFIPAKFNSVDLMNSLSGFDWKGKKVLLPAGNLSGQELSKTASAGGAIVDQVVVYETRANDILDEDLKSRVTDGQFDSVVFFSPSQVKNFIREFGVSSLRGKEIAVIGPTTKKAVENFGINVDVVPENSTTEDLITSLVNHEKVG